jgi:hypothetical protein
MRDKEGYVILHKGVLRTFRDKRETYEAARFAKSRTKGEIIDRATGTRLIMLEDGRTG